MCREQSVGKLDPFKDRIAVIPGATDDREVIERAVEGCGGVLVVLVPRRSRLPDRNGPGRARLLAARRTPRVLIRMAHHA